jgi:DNA-binding response OmpR family regulator
MDTLGPAESAELAVLREANGRVVSRLELARKAGLRDASPRRADSILVSLRRTLGDDAIRTVRSRGWALDPGHGAHDVERG